MRRDDQCRGGVEQDGVAIGALLAVEQAAQRGGVIGGVAAPDRGKPASSGTMRRGRSALPTLTARLGPAVDNSSSPSSPEITAARSVPSCSSASA